MPDELYEKMQAYLAAGKLDRNKITWEVVWNFKWLPGTNDYDYIKILNWIIGYYKEENSKLIERLIESKKD